MPTTDKVISQVQCQACNESMSAKNFNYSHAAYCIQGVQEVDTPKVTPAPKNIIPKLKKLLAVNSVKQDEEIDDEEVKIFQGSFIPSDDLELYAITKLKTQIIKAQEECNTNNKRPD